MAERILTRRELNRALLARQLLLERQRVDVLTAIEQLVAMQSQIPNPPYIGLWTRLRDFQRADLTEAMAARQVVRAALLRSTLHLVSAADHQRFRLTLQPALEKGLRGFFSKRMDGLGPEKLVAAILPHLEEAPRSTGEIRALLSAVEPDGDPAAMSYIVRTYLPLVQVPPGGTWGVGSAASYVTAESWLGGPPEPADVGALFLRYLAAFGPASIKDFQAWAGMTGLSKALVPVSKGLRRFRDEGGTTLFDLPDAPLPPAESPAPVRLMPEYDNLLLGHADRTRIIDAVYRKQVFLTAGRIASTFLVDGFVGGTWKIAASKKAATLRLTPFGPLDETTGAALISEGEALLRFVAEDAAMYEVRFNDGA